MITGFLLPRRPWRLAVAAALATLSAIPAQVRWEVLSATGPSPRYGHGLAYDAARRRTVLFGGSNAAGAICIGPAFPGCTFLLGGGVLSETWEWDGQSWFQAFPAASPPATQSAGSPNPAPWIRLLTYDAARAVCVLLTPGPTPGTQVLWQWNGVVWSASTLPCPALSFFATAAAYDAARGVTVWFGSDIVEWNGTSLVGRGPIAPGIVAAAFDEARGRVVGVSQQGPSMLTWEWDGASLQLRSTPIAPPVRQTTAFAYDARRQVVVMNAGQSPVGVQLDDLWEWDGSAWTPRASSPPLGARSFHAMSYHRACDHLLVFGGRLLTTLFSMNCPCVLPPGCTLSLPCFDSAITSYGDLLRCAESGPGQANGPAAGLVLRDCFGRDAVPGPVPATVLAGAPVRLSWTGPPLQPFVLFAGPLNPAAANAGCPGSVDIGTPPAFLDLVTLFDGLSNPVFVLDATGRAQQLVLVPALPPGPLVDLQGVVLQPTGATCPFVATAAFSVAIE